jgi:hypothetical protein
MNPNKEIATNTDIYVKNPKKKKKKQQKCKENNRNKSPNPKISISILRGSKIDHLRGSQTYRTRRKKLHERGEKEERGTKGLPFSSDQLVWKRCAIFTHIYIWCETMSSTSNVSRVILLSNGSIPPKAGTELDILMGGGQINFFLK